MVRGEVYGSAGGRRRATTPRTQCAEERDRLQIRGRVRGGTHPEHVEHGCDAGGVEAQRLVERRRGLPRVERRAYRVERGAGWEAGGGGRPQRTQRAGGARLQIGGRARGGAHPEHLIHACDAGGVETQRLVERPSVLPRVERRECGAGRGIRVGRREAAGDHAAHAACRRGSTMDRGQGTGRSAPRTCGPWL